MTPTLATARLQLRGFQPNDLDLLRRLDSDPEIMHFLGDGQPLDRSITQERLTAAIFRSTHQDIPTWAVFRLADKAFIGRCGFAPWGEAGDIELAYTLVPSAWGQGYATEAARAGLDHLFSLDRWAFVLARTRPTNTRSQRVLQKLGFALQYEGTDAGGAAWFYRLDRAAWHSRAPGDFD